MEYFKITNRHNAIIWEGEAHSFMDAWHKMFERCSYPIGDQRSICKQIESGMWIERVYN